MAGKPHTIDPNESWQRIKSNWIIEVTGNGVLASAILSVLFIIWRWNRLPPLIPLWYSRPWGTDQLTSPFWLILLPAGGVTIYYINRMISKHITSEYLIFTQMLYLSALLVNILSLVTLVKILFLVT